MLKKVLISAVLGLSFIGLSGQAIAGDVLSTDQISRVASLEMSLAPSTPDTVKRIRLAGGNTKIINGRRHHCVYTGCKRNPNCGVFGRGYFSIGPIRCKPPLYGFQCCKPK